MAGLRAVVAGQETDQSSPDWETAAGYTERMQTMIQETVALLGDAECARQLRTHGQELAATIRNRNQPAAAEKGVVLEVDDGFPGDARQPPRQPALPDRQQSRAKRDHGHRPGSPGVRRVE